MISEIMTETELAALLKREHPVCRFPAASDRAAWKRVRTGSLRRERIRALMLAANRLLKQSAGGQIYPDMTAEQAFAFIRTGNRGVFERPYFARRAILSTLVTAECLEYKGRFMPQIIEGLWKIISEPYWFLSAHGLYAPDDPMPRHDSIMPDLFACETAMTLAMTDALLGNEIRRISPQLMIWVRDLVCERVIGSIERKTGWWYSGVNNWAPWCASNSAGAAIVFLRDQPERLARLLTMLAGVCDRFYDRYAPEGGCDEGPAYFCRAGLMLMSFIDHMDLVSGGAYAKLFREKKMRNIAEYFVRVGATGNWFVSPADSSAKMSIFNRGLLLRFAELVGSDEMRGFILHLKDRIAPTPGSCCYGSQDFGMLLQQLFFVPDRAGRKPTRRPLFTEQKDLQIYVLRQNADETKDAILSLKGGHNGENHNHNDVGQFELFFDGEPLIVDLGTSTYTRFTFLPETRYNSFVHSAAGHNIPVINGILQPPGKEYHAETVEAKPGKVVLDLTKAYPPECNLKAYSRCARLDKDACSITDTLAFSGKAPVPFSLSLYCASKPAVRGGYIRLGKLNMSVSGIAFDRIEKIPLTDASLASVWGKAIWKIVFSGKAENSAEWSFRWEK